MVVDEYQAVGVHTSFPVEQRKLVYSRRKLVGRNFDGRFAAVVELDVIIGFRYAVVHDLQAENRFRVRKAEDWIEALTTFPFCTTAMAQPSFSGSGNAYV